ncbi:MAG TPA: tetratricopeptide repeat protein [Spirochaetota bacterium]|nr:tetratricopeptide repeat protein [Spirochaetota bacterium]
MSNVVVFAVVFGSAGFAVFTFFLLKTVISPKKLRRLESLIADNNIKAAIRQAKTFLVRNERNPDAHWWLGECYRTENRPDLAIVEYRYITNAGSFTGTATQRKVRRRLAEEYFKLGQIDESQKEYILLSKLEPGNYENYYEIARLFEQRNYTDSALANYKKTVTINPKHVESHVRLGRIYLKKQLVNEAKQVFLTALKYDPLNSMSHYHLGRIARTSGDPSAALTHFEKALKDPDLKQRALLERANIFVIKGERQRAVNELQRALRVGEKDIPAVIASHYLLARCYELDKDLLQAVEHWEEIYRKNPKYRDVSEKLALYSTLRADDYLKDFLTASQENFQNTAGLIVRSMGLAVHDVFLKSQDLVEIYALETQSRWRDAKKATIIVRIYRSAEPVGYDEIRGLYDVMRKIGSLRSICLATSPFTKSAVEFAQIRPIDLVKQEEFIKLLHSIKVTS